MSKKIIFAVLTMFSGATLAQPRGGGSEGGGGGSRIESAFRVAALSLINEIAANAYANDLCPADLLRSRLNSARILVVGGLVDPHTGHSVETGIDLNTGGQWRRHLDAWTVPGLIQLKASSWQMDLRPPRTQELETLILHEIYRLTDSCNDDTGALSVEVGNVLRAARASEYEKNRWMGILPW